MNDGDKTEVVRRFLTLLASGRDYEAWGAMIAQDVERLTPFVPPGLAKRILGRAEFLRSTRDVFQSIKDFRWIDLDLHNTDEPDVVYGTSRSYLELVDGRHYENQYVFIVKFENGLIREFREYLDPIPVMACFAEELASGIWKS
jgi:ketosteroid isomerase-like protein